MEFLIGDKITWQAGNVVCKGVYLEETENGFIKVIAHYIGERKSGVELRVLKSVIKKADW